MKNRPIVNSFRPEFAKNRTAHSENIMVFWFCSKWLVWSEFDLCADLFVSDRFIHLFENQSHSYFFRHIHTFEISEWKIHVKANFYQWFFSWCVFFSVKILEFLPYLWIIHIFIVLIIKSITLMNEYQINDHSREISIKRNFFRWIKMLHFHSSELPFFFSFIYFYCLKLNDGRSHMWYFGISSLFCWYFCDCVCCSILPARTFIIQFQAVKSILESDTYKHKTGLFHLSVILKIDTV